LSKIKISNTKSEYLLKQIKTKTKIGMVALKEDLKIYTDERFVKKEKKTKINVQDKAIDKTINLIKRKSSNNNSIKRTKLSGMLRRACNKTAIHFLLHKSGYMKDPAYPEKWLEGIDPDRVINR